MPAMLLKNILTLLLQSLLPKKVGIKLIILLLEWAAKKTEWKWDDKLVDAIKKSV
jgi:hypothetical protein